MNAGAKGDGLEGSVVVGFFLLLRDGFFASGWFFVALGAALVLVTPPKPTVAV